MRRGELLGLAGLRGAGQEDIGRALFGATPHQGVVTVDDEAIDLSSPHMALRQGVGLMARDRGEVSIAPTLSIRENLFLNPAASGRRAFSPLAPRREAGRAIRVGASLDLRPNDPAMAIESLSGGNQQKIVVGRWLATGRRLLVAEDPTAGVDVGAKAEIYGTDGAGARRRPRGDRGVDRLRGNRADLPSRDHLQPGPDRRRTRGRGADHRGPDHGGVGVRDLLKRSDPMAINSFKSNALEPTWTELRQLPLSARLMRLLPIYGLVILTVLLAVIFSLILPTTFPTILNVRSIISDKSIIAILSLAAMIPMVTGKIDLTIGYGIVLWHILVISLQEWFGVPWPLAVLIVLCFGGVVGLFNGLLVEIAQIDSFIATLGTGTVLYAIAMWHSQGHQIMGVLPDGFIAVSNARLLGLPVTGFYVLALAFALWFILEYLPIGRYFYAIGANPKAAALNGIPVRRYTIAAFVASGVLTAAAGVMLASKLRVGQASVGLEFLLPALVGVFLGSTTIKPGRFNVWGTLVGVVILAIGISGIQQVGGEFWVEPFFNGATLILAIGIAGYTQRRRISVPRLEPISTTRDAKSARERQGENAT